MSCHSGSNACWLWSPGVLLGSKWVRQVNLDHFRSKLDPPILFPPGSSIPRYYVYTALERKVRRERVKTFTIVSTDELGKYTGNGVHIYMRDGHCS